MVYHRVAHYLWLKGETYYFNRRVPKDVQSHYRCKRIIICLKTSRKDTALRSARSLAQRLEDYWLSLRLAKIEIPALHLMHQRPINAASQTDISLKDALALYLRLKGSGKGASFHRAAERNIQSVIEVLGDRPLDGYASSDTASYINKWLKLRVPEGCVIHSFRHSLRDRLRAAQCPSDMIDQIGGWSTAGVGQAYGEGYSVSGLHDFMLDLTHEA